MVAFALSRTLLSRLFCHSVFRCSLDARDRSLSTFKLYGKNLGPIFHLQSSTRNVIHVIQRSSPMCFEKSIGFSNPYCSARFYKKWNRCSTARTFDKNNDNEHQRWRNERSAGSVKPSLHFRCKQFQETRNKVAEKMEELKENVVTIPNALCVLRIVASPFLGYFVLQEFYLFSLGLFVFAGFTDLIDGYIARAFPGQQSMIGSFLDPAADKLLISTLFLALTVNGLIPVPLTSLIIVRDACLMTAGFYIRYVSLPPPKTLSRYFDVSFATARLSPTGISKVNTVFQLSLVGLSLGAPVFGYVDHLALQVFWYVTAATTVLSAGSYLYYKNTYKFLTMKNKAKKLISKES